MIAFLERNKFQGLTIDFEEVPPTAHKDLQLFLAEMAARFVGHGYVIVLAVPFDDDSWPYATYAKIADYLLLMGYDQHWEEGTAGSIAGQSWFEQTLDKRMKELNPDRTIIAIGDYGYDWVKGQPAEDLTFEEAVLSARDSGANIEPRTRTSPSSRMTASTTTFGSLTASRPSMKSTPQTPIVPPATRCGGLVPRTPRSGRC
jgi:spore germination protein YaaH